MSAFTADLEQLDEVVTALQTFESDLEQHLETLDGRIARLQGTWNGAAADAQQAAHREWMTGAARMRQALAEIRAAAATAHANYSAAVQANTAMWG